LGGWTRCRMTAGRNCAGQDQVIGTRRLEFRVIDEVDLLRQQVAGTDFADNGPDLVDGPAASLRHAFNRLAGKHAVRKRP